MKLNNCNGKRNFRSKARISRWIGTSLLGLLISLGGLALANTPKGGGNGNDLPSPFLNFNQKVELADGEHYVLLGKILQKEGFFYFKPDFSKHSWLANNRRMQWPYYPIELSVSVSPSLVGKTVRFSGRAIGRIFFTDDQHALYSLFLAPEGEEGLKPFSSFATPLH